MVKKHCLSNISAICAPGSDAQKLKMTPHIDLTDHFTAAVVARIPAPILPGLDKPSGALRGAPPPILMNLAPAENSDDEFQPTPQFLRTPTVCRKDGATLRVARSASPTNSDPSFSSCVASQKKPKLTPKSPPVQIFYATRTQRQVLKFMPYPRPFRLSLAPPASPLHPLPSPSHPFPVFQSPSRPSRLSLTPVH